MSGISSCLPDRQIIADSNKYFARGLRFRTAIMTNRALADVGSSGIDHHPGEFAITDLRILQGILAERGALLGQHFVDPTRLASSILQVVTPLPGVQDA